MRCGSEEGIVLLSQRVANPVHLVRDFVGCVARNVLVKGGSIHVAPRPAAAVGEELSSLEDVVWNRNRSFHTGSITRRAGRALLLLLDPPGPGSGDERGHA